MSESNETDILMNGEEWFAKNWSKLVNITLVILITVVAVSWWNNKESASSSEAESALVNALSSGNTNLTDVALSLKDVHGTYKGEPVAERALILSAKTSLEAGDYDNAQNRFGSYLSEFSTGKWVDEAKLGQAVCKEAKGDTSGAITIYQSLTKSTPSKTIQARATALLEAAQTNLDPLPSRPEPVVEPEVATPEVPVPGAAVEVPEPSGEAPPAPAVPDDK